MHARMIAASAGLHDDDPMSTPRTPDEASSPAATEAETDGAAPEAPKKHRNPWIWISAVLALGAAGLLIWALVLQGDLDSTQQDVEDLQTQVDQNEESGSAVVAAAKSLYDDLAQQIGATSEDLDATRQELDDAEQAAAKAEQDVAAAKDQAAQAGDEVDKAKAEADQAKAETEAASSKAAVAADCAKAYVGAFGALLEGESVRAQAPVVREQLNAISADCKSALSGG
jgi:uncharacterized protein (DUF3084 family)